MNVFMNECISQECSSCSKLAGCSCQVPVSGGNGDPTTVPQLDAPHLSLFKELLRDRLVANLMFQFEGRGSDWTDGTGGSDEFFGYPAVATWYRMEESFSTMPLKMFWRCVSDYSNIWGKSDAFPRSAGGQKLGEGSEGSSWLGGNLRLPSRWFATWRNGIAKEPKASMSRMSMSKIGTAVLGTSTERNCIFIFFRLSHMSKTGFNIDNTEVFGWNRAAKFITLHANLPNFQGWELYYIYNWITSSYEMASRLVG